MRVVAEGKLTLSWTLLRSAPASLAETGKLNGDDSCFCFLFFAYPIKQQKLSSLSGNYGTQTNDKARHNSVSQRKGQLNRQRDKGRVDRQ